MAIREDQGVSYIHVFDTEEQNFDSRAGNVLHDLEDAVLVEQVECVIVKSSLVTFYC